MEYRFRFKQLEEGQNPEAGYEKVISGLQYRAPDGMSVSIQLRLGILLDKMSSGHTDGTEMLIPKGKILEVILTD